MAPEKDDIKGEWIKAPMDGGGELDVFIGESEPLPEIEEYFGTHVVRRDDRKIAEMLKDPERIKQAKEALLRASENP